MTVEGIHVRIVRMCTQWIFLMHFLLSAASFIPPDAEDPATPMELDPEDLEWQAWLNNLLNPSG